MALDTSVGRRFTVDELVKLAYQKAGLLQTHMTLDAARAEEGRRYLELILDGLAVEGMVAREIRWVDLELVVNTQAYTLDSDVLSVEGDGYFGDSDLLVTQKGTQGWHEATDTDDEGAPRIFYVLSTGTSLQVNVAPIPNEAGTLRLRCRKLLSDCKNGQSTLNVELGFHYYLVTKLQADLMEAKYSPQYAASTARKAESMLDKAMGHSRENVNGVFELDLQPW